MGIEKEDIEIGSLFGIAIIVSVLIRFQHLYEGVILFWISLIGVSVLVEIDKRRKGFRTRL